MRERYLEVTFRKGKPFAAYLYLPRASGIRSTRTERMAPGLLADFGPSGEVIGLEITAPTHAAIDSINEVLERLGQPTIDADELAPLATAA